MKDRSIGKRIALTFGAIAIGFVIGYVVFVILGLFLPWYEVMNKAFGTGAGLGLGIYLTYKWSGRTIALIVAAVVIVWIILQVVIGGMFMWSSLSV
jgi:hypothetical protein